MKKILSLCAFMALCASSVYATNAKMYVLELKHGKDVQTMNFVVGEALEPISFINENTIESTFILNSIPFRVPLTTGYKVEVNPINNKNATIQISHSWASEGGTQHKNQASLVVDLTSLKTQKAVIDKEEYEINIKKM